MTSSMAAHTHPATHAPCRTQVVGSAALDTDVLMRTLGVYAAGQRAYTVLSHEARSAIDAYTAGVRSVLPGCFLQ